MRTVIGIDVGGSTTKIVGFRDQVMMQPIHVKATDPITSLFGGFGRYISENSLQLSDITKIVVTGVGASFVKDNIYGIPTEKVDEFNLGMLIALYERAVAAYAELIHINAFHQPGVQAYKLASKDVIKLLTTLEDKLAKLGEFSGTVADFAAKLDLVENEFELDGILAKLAKNAERRDLSFGISRAWNKDRGWVYTVK